MPTPDRVGIATYQRSMFGALICGDIATREGACTVYVVVAVHSDGTFDTSVHETYKDAALRQEAYCGMGVIATVYEETWSGDYLQESDTLVPDGKETSDIAPAYLRYAAAMRAFQDHLWS